MKGYISCRNSLSLNDIGLRQVGVDRHGPKYRKEDVHDAIVRMIIAERFFYSGAKKMTEDARKAIALSNEVRAELSQSLELFNGTQKRFVDVSKQASGAIRDAADKLAGGLAKVERAADFSRLERYVELLERASAAMTTLSALEKDGRLEKIAGALK